MENVSMKKSFSDLSSRSCASLVNQHSLLNLESSRYKVHPFRWVLGFILLSNFILAFASAGGNYLTELFKLLILTLILILGACLVEKFVIGRFSEKRKYVSQLDRSRMLLFSLLIWSVSIFVFLSVFITL